MMASYHEASTTQKNRGDVDTLRFGDERIK